jgi:uncharacterized protein (DUF433 family)
MSAQPGTGESAEVVHPYVERRAGVQGGRPVIKGSRFPVSSIVQNHRRGLSVDEILCDFPHLAPAEVYDALSYYYDHRAEIDAEIVALNDLTAVMQDHPPTRQPSGRGNGGR